jgi:hypothetical protein
MLPDDVREIAEGLAEYYGRPGNCPTIHQHEILTLARYVLSQQAEGECELDDKDLERHAGREIASLVGCLNAHESLWVGHQGSPVEVAMSLIERLSVAEREWRAFLMSAGDSLWLTFGPDAAEAARALPVAEEAVSVSGTFDCRTPIDLRKNLWPYFTAWPRATRSLPLPPAPGRGA